MTDFTLEIDADGVAIITWDVPGKSMNVLSRAGYQELSDLIDRAIDDEAVKGVILTSGKRDFAGGMDLNVLAVLREEAGDNPAQALFDFTMNGHKVLRKMLHRRQSQGAHGPARNQSGPVSGRRRGHTGQSYGRRHGGRAYLAGRQDV